MTERAEARTNMEIEQEWLQEKQGNKQIFEHRQTLLDIIDALKKSDVRIKIMTSKRNKDMNRLIIRTDNFYDSKGNKAVSYTHLTLPTTPYV